MIFVGVDPGKHTGLAVWNGREFTYLDTLLIHDALHRVRTIAESGERMKVFFEDARQRKWFTGNVRAKEQGAGSIKRDCTIWEDFCTSLHIDFTAQPPRAGLTKMSPEYFAKLTGYKGRTSNHARDAAMLVFGR